MSALENLNGSITRLTAAVDTAVAEWHKPSATDEQVQAAAEAVNAQAERLESLVAPPPAP